MSLRDILRITECDQRIFQDVACVKTKQEKQGDRAEENVMMYFQNTRPDESLHHGD